MRSAGRSPCRVTLSHRSPSRAALRSDAFAARSLPYRVRVVTHLDIWSATVPLAARRSPSLGRGESGNSPDQSGRPFSGGGLRGSRTNADGRGSPCAGPSTRPTSNANCSGRAWMVGTRNTVAATAAIASRSSASASRTTRRDSCGCELCASVCRETPASEALVKHARTVRARVSAMIRRLPV